MNLKKARRRPANAPASAPAAAPPTAPPEPQPPAAPAQRPAWRRCRNIAVWRTARSATGRSWVARRRCQSMTRARRSTGSTQRQPRPCRGRAAMPLRPASRRPAPSAWPVATISGTVSSRRAGIPRRLRDARLAVEECQRQQPPPAAAARATRQRRQCSQQQRRQQRLARHPRGARMEQHVDRARAADLGPHAHSPLSRPAAVTAPAEPGAAGPGHRAAWRTAAGRSRAAADEIAGGACPALLLPGFGPKLMAMAARRRRPCRSHR